MKGVLVDVDTGVIRKDHVLVQHTPGAVFFLGFGSRAARLRRFACDEAGEDDTFFARCRGIAEAAESGRLAKARRAGMPRAVLAIEDRVLRRLFIAEALAKSGYDPDEPRDDHGRWTSAGGSGAAAVSAAVATTGEAIPLLLGDLGSEALAGLAEIGARFAVPTAFLGTVFIPIATLFTPTNSSVTRDGTLPDRPDISYHFDLDTGTLTLAQGGMSFYSGHAGTDGLFRDESGRALGRQVEGSLVLDPDALPGYAARSDGGAQSRARVQPLLQADTDRGEPKLCPAPSEEDISGRSERALAYQEQITQLPRGLEVVLPDPNGGKPVRYDGCCEVNPNCQTDGDMLEAKGEGYENLMDRTGGWQGWFTKLDDLENQMRRQNMAAGAVGRTVEWHFAEKGPADYFRDYAEQNIWKNTVVMWTPAMRP